MKFLRVFYILVFLTTLLGCGAYSKMPLWQREPAPAAQTDSTTPTSETPPAPTPTPSPADPNAPAPYTGFDITTWDELWGFYDLINFDGTATPPFNPKIIYGYGNWDYVGTHSRIEMLKLPLYSLVGEGYGSHFSLGPIDNVGTGSIQTNPDGSKTFKYFFDGNLAESSGRIIAVIFSLTVEKRDTLLNIHYSLETSHTAGKIEHSFILRKKKL